MLKLQYYLIIHSLSSRGVTALIDGEDKVNDWNDPCCIKITGLIQNQLIFVSLGIV